MDIDRTLLTDAETEPDGGEYGGAFENFDTVRSGANTKEGKCEPQSE